MCTTTESWHIIEDDKQKLFTKTWKPIGESHAKLIFIHGYSHHCDMYSDFFTSLTVQGITVFAYDQRGFGRSATTPKSKGLTSPTSRLLADITSIVSPQLQREIPLFLMGHSMGGTTVFTYACEGPVDIVAQIRGFLGEAPDFGFPLRCPNSPSQLLLLASKLGKYVLPKMQVMAKLHPETLSPDPKIQTDYMKDTLCHETITVEGISGHFERYKLLNNGTFKPRDCVRSIWVGCSPEDLCVSYDACAEWIKKLDIEDKELRTYNGWSHCLHAEAGDRNVTFAKDVGDWILKCSGNA